MTLDEVKAWLVVMKEAISKQAQAAQLGLINARRGRMTYMIILTLMITSIVVSFIHMATVNKGIVAKFGVVWAAIISLATGAAGLLIGININKFLKKKHG